MEDNSDYRNTQMEQSVDAEACNIAKEIYMKYNPEMQNRFVKEFIKSMRKYRVDGIQSAQKDIQFLSEQFYACP